MSMIRRESAAVLIGLALVLAAFGSTLMAFHQRWASMELGYSHGYPVLLIMLYVIYERRQDLLRLPRQAFAPALVPLALLSLAWLLADAVQVQVLQQLLLPAIVSLWLCAALGRPLFWALLVPLMLLYLAVPVWDVLVNPLRVITVRVVQTWLQWGDYTAIVDGFHITVPAGRFRVAGGCSGLNYFLTAMTLAVVYAVLYLRGIWRRLLFALICVLIALLVNWIRVFALVLLGYYTDMQSGLIADHGNFGWVLFAIALVPLFWIGTLIERGEAAVLEQEGEQSATAPPMSLPMLAAATLVAVLGPLLGLILQYAAAQQPITLLPAASSAWRAQPASAAPWSLAYRGFDRAALFTNDTVGESVALRILYFDRQTQGKELVSDLNQVADKSRILASDRVQLDGNMLLNEVIVQDGRRRRLLWWAYYIDSALHTGVGAAKLAQLQALFGGQTGAALLVFDSDCSGVRGDCSRARRALSALVPATLAPWLPADSDPQD